MKEKRTHITHLLSVVLLMVFAIALTPFSAFHHHHNETPKCTKTGDKCAHSFHIHNHADTCLICAAHFEKTYTHSESYYQLFQENKPVSSSYTIISSSYTALIRLALRGPPAGIA